MSPGAKTKKPRAEHQGVPVAVPTDALGQLATELGAMKAEINDRWSTLVHQAAAARGELLVTRKERDDARAEVVRLMNQVVGLQTELEQVRQEMERHVCTPPRTTSPGPDPDMGHLFAEEAAK